MRYLGALAVAVTLVIAGTAAPTVQARPAKQRPKRPRTELSDDWASARSAQYAALDRGRCLAELGRRGVRFREAPGARGVLAPVRLLGPVRGVEVHSDAPPPERAESPHEVMDCRLALAVDDLAALAAARGVVELEYFSAWRPPPPSHPADKPATRHPGGLALDLKRLVRATASGASEELVVERDWTPARDVPPCGDAPISPDTAAARALREVFCTAAKERLFTVMLSPNYDADHRNHFHLEITPGVRWRMVL